MSFVASDCLYEEGNISVLCSVPRMSYNNSVLSKQEVSLLNMSNNEISHYTDERS